MKNLTPQNVTVHCSEFGDFALMCEFEGARYHIWLDRKSRELSNTLYKNPPLSIAKGEPGYYSARKLTPDSQFGAALIVAMLRIANEEKMFERAEEKVIEEREQEITKNRAAIALEKIREAGPKLLEILERIMESESLSDSLLPKPLMQEIEETIKRLRG